MRILFASDVHAGAVNARATEAFCAFLQAGARSARALYLLGDIFDAWLGDDDQRPPHPHIAALLRSLTDNGTDVYAVHGNHDFLLGEQFCAYTGVQLLPEISTLELNGTKAVLCHGDELCTDDQPYQAYRSYTRDTDNQARFLSLPLQARGEEARKLAQASAAANADKTEQIMDVNSEAVAQLLRNERARLLIHGHTHRPADHDFELDGTSARRLVLGNWHERESILVWEDGVFTRTTADAMS